MNQYKALAKELFAEYAATLRKRKNLTQDATAEELHISSRAYGDLEREKCCFSAITLLFFLLLLSDEEIEAFRTEFRKRVHDLEHKDVANPSNI